MTSLAQWLARYAESHQNPINKRLHFICVPSIFWSLLALLYMIPVPVLGLPGYLANAAVLVMLCACVFYMMLSWRAGIIMLAWAIVMMTTVIVIQLAGLPLFYIALVVFVLAWAGQFIGHHIEGKRPSFIDDLRFLLIGPIWVLIPVLGRIGIRLDDQ